MTVFTPEENTEIVEKHPQVTDTLTEAEKNTALSECHEKSGIFENAEDEPPRETLRTPTVNGFVLWSALTLIGALLCFVTAVAGAPIAALFMAAALTLTSGLTYALKGNSWKKRKTEATAGGNRPFGLWSVLTFIGALLCFVTAVAGAPTAALFMAAALTLTSGLTYALKGNSREKRKTEAAAGGNPSSAVPPSAPAASENKNQGDNSDGNNGE